MARKTNPEFAEAVDSDEVVVDEPMPVIATSPDSNLVNARVKGTWTMFWGRSRYEFVDGNRYKLPKDLFAYLRSSGNIYDTL
jgi:hypothetical protein